MKALSTLLLLPVLFAGCAGSARSSAKVYSVFADFAQRNGIDLHRNRQYSEGYVSERGQNYCAWLAGGDFTRISTEVSFPPVRSWLESPKDRSRLEVLIGDAAVLTQCPGQRTNWLRWRQGNVR